MFACFNQLPSAAASFDVEFKVTAKVHLTFHARCCARACKWKDKRSRASTRARTRAQAPAQPHALSRPTTTDDTQTPQSPLACTWTKVFNTSAPAHVLRLRARRSQLTAMGYGVLATVFQQLVRARFESIAPKVHCTDRSGACLCFADLASALEALHAGMFTSPSEATPPTKSHSTQASILQEIRPLFSNVPR
jgi:hypothetical protein